MLRTLLRRPAGPARRLASTFPVLPNAADVRSADFQANAAAMAAVVAEMEARVADIHLGRPPLMTAGPADRLQVAGPRRASGTRPAASCCRATASPACWTRARPSSS